MKKINLLWILPLLFIMSISFSFAYLTYSNYDFSNPVDYCSYNTIGNATCVKYPNMLVLTDGTFTLPFNVNNFTGNTFNATFNIALKSSGGGGFNPLEDRFYGSNGAFGYVILIGNYSYIFYGVSGTEGFPIYNFNIPHNLSITFNSPTYVSFYINGVIVESALKIPAYPQPTSFNGTSFRVYGDMEIYKMNVLEGIRVNEFPSGLTNNNYNLTCDNKYCLFYDDFYLNTSQTGYTGYINTTEVQNNTLFFNSYTNTSTLIENTFLQTDTYKKIVYYMSFKTNYNVIPDSLNFSNGDRETFSTWLKCSDGTYPFNINFDIFSWNTYSGNYDYTTFALYDNAYKTLAMYDIKNGDTIVFKFIIDKENNKLSISSKRSNNPYDASLYSFSDIPDVASVDIPECNIYNGIALMRKDAYFSNSTYYIGIDKLLVSGYDFTETEFKSSLFLYTNETTQNNSIIKGDFGESLQDTAFKYGFKTTGSKLLLWFIIMVIGLIIIFKNANNLGTFATSIVSTFFTITIFVLGWYLGFIPTALLVFVVFMCAIVGAVVIKNLFSGGN